MSFDLFRTGVPCLMPGCGVRIVGWDDETARPCGHTLDEIVEEADVFVASVQRVEFGQYAQEGVAP